MHVGGVCVSACGRCVCECMWEVFVQEICRLDVRRKWQQRVKVLKRDMEYLFECFVEGPKCFWINVCGKKQCTSYRHYIIPPLHHTAITSYRHYIIPPLHHTAITSYRHYIIPPLHHTAITSYRHYIIPPLHHTTIASYRHYTIPPLHHTAITSYRHYIIPPLHYTTIASYRHYIIPPLHHTTITSYRHYITWYTIHLLVVLPWESTRWRLLADSASVAMAFSRTIFRKSFKPTKREERR